MYEIVFVVEEAPEGGYTARALGESIFTEGDSLDGCVNLRGEGGEGAYLKRGRTAPERLTRAARLRPATPRSAPATRFDTAWR